MRADEFEMLAARVLAGEATAGETARLEAALAQDAERAAGFAELRATWETLKVAGPLADALDAPPEPPPPERLRTWQAALHSSPGNAANRVPTTVYAGSEETAAAHQSPRRRVFGAPLGWLAAACLVAALLAGMWRFNHRRAPASVGPAAYLVTAEGAPEVLRAGQRVVVEPAMTLRQEDEVRLASGTSATVITPAGVLTLRGPETFRAGRLPAGGGPPGGDLATNGALQLALFQSGPRVQGLLVTTRGSESIPVYSPVGATASRTPVILWKSEPGKTYELAITDELDTSAGAWRMGATVPPVYFTNAWPGRALAPDGLYRLRLVEAGRPLTATELTFRVLPGTEHPAAPPAEPGLVAAYALLAGNAARFGDALALLLTLPAEVADSELALRLKVLAFGQLGYQEDFEATLARLRDRP